MAERRYNEDEVATIFANATESAEPARRPVAETGLTLTELQEIGREVGLSPDAVANAAKRLDQSSLAGWRQPAAITRRFFGMPIAVGRTVELPRRLSDEEWDQVVADLRSTFDARGVVRADSASREWRNGRLRAVLDRSETGERFRISTVKGNAFGWIWGGAGALSAAAILFGTVVAETAAYDNTVLRGIFTSLAIGIALLAGAAIKLPQWARLRRQQIDNVISRLLLGISE